MDAETFDNTKDYDEDNPKTTQDKINPTAKILFSNFMLCSYAHQNKINKITLNKPIEYQIV